MLSIYVSKFIYLVYYDNLLHIYLFKLVTNQLEGFVNGISMSGDCDDTFRARSVANINFGTTLKKRKRNYISF